MGGSYLDLRGHPSQIVRDRHGSAIRCLYYAIVGFVGFLLSPVLVFALGYLFGRGLDLSETIVGPLGALAGGSLVGYGIARSLTYGWMVSVSEGSFGVLAALGFVVPALVRSVAIVALVGFAGVALAYLLTTRRTGTSSRLDGVDSTTGD